jgi:hypothetical protein
MVKTNAKNVIDDIFDTKKQSMESKSEEGADSKKVNVKKMIDSIKKKQKKKNVNSSDRKKFIQIDYLEIDFF